MSAKEAYFKALKVLYDNSVKEGFLATKVSKNNYRRVWCRDGVIQGIASLMSEDERLIKTFERTLYSLKGYQDPTGRIPSNVNVQTDEVSYGTHVGKVDATLWYLIGVGQYYKFTKNKKFLKDFFDSFSSAIFYLSCLELNGKGLLHIPTGGDWADEYITQGYVLLDQILYFLALREYEEILRDLERQEEADLINHKANFLEERISVNYFPSTKEKNKKAIYSDALYKRISKKFNKDYALISFSSNGFTNYLDSLSNSLLLLLDICSLAKREKILKTLRKRLKRQKIKILPAFWPPIRPKDKTYWNILKMNSLFEFRNKPNHYHNGGLWPLVQGIFITGVINSGKRTIAREYLEEFASAMKKDKYRFHEYFESKGYTPKGVAGLGYSAAGYVIAYNSVIKNKKAFL